MSRRKRVLSAAGVIALQLLGACAAENPDTSGVQGEGNPATTQDAGEPATMDSGTPPRSDAPDAGLPGTDVPPIPGCGALRAIVRDFTPTHPDFESKRCSLKARRKRAKRSRAW